MTVEIKDILGEVEEARNLLDILEEAVVLDHGEQAELCDQILLQANLLAILVAIRAAQREA